MIKWWSVVHYEDLGIRKLRPHSDHYGFARRQGGDLMVSRRRPNSYQSAIRQGQERVE